MAGPRPAGGGPINRQLQRSGRKELGWPGDRAVSTTWPFQHGSGRRQGRGLDRLVRRSSALIAAEATEAALAIASRRYKHDAALAGAWISAGRWLSTPRSAKSWLKPAARCRRCRAGRSAGARCRSPRQGACHVGRGPAEGNLQRAPTRLAQESPPPAASRSIRACTKQSTCTSGSSAGKV